MRPTYNLCKRVVRSLPFLMFINGFVLASILYFLVQSTYENGLFASVKSDIESRIDANDTQDSIVVKAMGITHDLMFNRASTFNHNARDLGPEEGIFHSASVDLMTTKGYCGSYSEVLARVLCDFHYPCRIAQMKAGNVWAAHNLVEVNTGNHWVLLDPTYNLYFIRPDHQIASYSDIQNNWKYYSQQVPEGYNMAYHYEDVRYTNWT